MKYLSYRSTHETLVQETNERTLFSFGFSTSIPSFLFSSRSVFSSFRWKLSRDDGSGFGGEKVWGRINIDIGKSLLLSLNCSDIHFQKDGKSRYFKRDGRPLSRETQRSVGQRLLAALTNFSGAERNKILVSILGFRVDAPFKSTESNYGEKEEEEEKKEEATGGRDGK